MANWCKFERNLFEIWFYTYFFIHVGSLRTGADHLFGTEFWCRMKPVVTVVNWCKFRKQIWLNCDFLHVHNPGAQADKPLGTEFWCRMKAFAMMANWWKFINKISVNCDLVHFFVFMITYLYIAQGHINPRDWIFMSNWFFSHYGQLVQVS